MHSINGRPLGEVNLPLFFETMEALRTRNLSAAGASLDEDEARIVAMKLATAKVRDFCKCGESGCRTYYFHVAPKPERSVSYHTVRFYARGEHLLHIDSDGDVHSVERLFEFYPQGADSLYSKIR